MAPNPSPVTPLPAAFRDLQRALVARRIRALDPVLRLEIAAIALLVAAFCGWQMRAPLDGIAHIQGPRAAARVLALSLLPLVALAGIAAGACYAGHLRPRTDGTRPAWLDLPIPPQTLARHMAWEARLIVPWALVPAAGAFVAAAGIVPGPLLALTAAGLVALLTAAGRAGCAAAFHLAVRGHAAALEPAASRLHPVERALVTATSAARHDPLPPARWRRLAPWRALWLKDLLVSRRPTPQQAAARSTLVVMVLSALVWRLPVDPGLAHAAAFALALAAAVALAEWLVALSGADPFPTVGVLPLGMAPWWASRVASAAAGAALLAALHALAFPALAPPALIVFLAWITAAALTIGVLGAQIGVTLHPRAGDARIVLDLTLVIALIASIAMPLLGWVLLLAAVAHSAGRLSRRSAGAEA